MKWPWNREPKPPQAPDELILARLLALEASVSGMTADTKLLRVEWAEVLDKISRWASRQSGRLAKQARENIDAAAQEPAGDTIPGREGIDAHRLTKADLRRLANQRRQPNGAHQ